MDRADSEPEPRCTVRGWVTILGRPTTLTDLFLVDYVLSFILFGVELSVANFQWLIRQLHLLHYRILAATQVQFQVCSRSCHSLLQTTP